MTQAQEQRIINDLSAVAGENINIHRYEDGEYLFLCATELGMYRLSDHYKNCNITKGYSENLNQWYVTLHN